MFEPHLTLWRLIADGEPIVTHSSRLLPVRLEDGAPAMLKITTGPDERWGIGLMLWWRGDGAVRVLAHDADAMLMERAAGTRSLAEMARLGEDDEASRIICTVADRLHDPNGRAPPPELVPLDRWFRELFAAAEKHGGAFTQSASVARELLSEPRDVAVLHGDLHHGNILDGGERGWLAIDPKRLTGEGGFDYANIFCNPDLETAVRPGRLARQVEVVADAAHLAPRRLLQWIVAYTGLSAAWTLAESGHPRGALSIGEIAAAELGLQDWALSR